MSVTQREIDAFQALVEKWLDERATAEEFAQIERAIVEHDELLEVYCDLVGVDATLSWQHRWLPKPAPADDGVLATMGEDLQTERARGGRARVALYRYAAAAVLLLIAGLAVTLWQRGGASQGPGAPQPNGSPEFATVTDTRGAVWEADAEPLGLGATLETGRLQLRAGVAELLTRSTATVSVLGPADVQMLGPNRCRLNSGRLVATVPEMAHGFTVETPAGTVVDLGTSFGVTVDRLGYTTVTVLQGSVEVRLADDDSAPVRLVAGEAARLALRERRVLPATFAATEYADVWTPHDALFGTGVGLQPGAADPHWRVTARSDDASFRARPATAESPIINVPETDTSRWISFDARGVVAVGVEVTFATTFDVAAGDTRQRIGMRYVVDNQLVAVRLNGETVPLTPKQMQDSTATGTLQRLNELLVIDRELAVGANTLEVVVRNTGGPQPTPVGLRAEFIRMQP
ncbi:MAG: hypothetical protein GC159_16495 [Phycisphaera sp.]|nr:hypothetical protein [Phycisphaera sp.]